ncbi:MAG: isochorismatase family protein, partial [Clostridia bacterium]|nr:isochorismatase family protein [Clostridia bacterium]
MKNILIVVDIQNGFNRYEQTHILADKIVKLTNSGVFDEIIATRFRNKEGSQYIKFLNWHRLIDSPDIELVDGIKADVVWDKWVYTCINDEFMALLKKLNDGEMPTH